MLLGDTAMFDFFDFTDLMKPTDLSVPIQQKLDLYQNKKEQVLLFTDLPGGTPYNVAVTLSQQYENIPVVTGCNISSLLEIAFQPPELDINAIADIMISTTNKTATKFEMTDSTSTDPETTDSDTCEFGI